MKYSTPVISIVMPLYNKESEVNRAVKSVFVQTVTDFELIVVNDGSTDKGPDIVRGINDPRVHIIDQKNAGVSAARNRGIQDARSDLIAFLDADDEWMPDFLETIFRLQKNYPTCAVFATNYLFRRANNYSRSTIIRGLPRGFKEGILTDYFKIASQSDPPLWTSAVAVTKRSIEAIGGFPLGVVAGEDLLTWARLAAKYDIAYTKEPKAFFLEPILASDRPGRVPNIPDFVGDELARLLKNSEPGRFPGLRRYISLWHRMRATIFIQLGEGRKAREEIQKAAYYSGMGLKLCILSAISIMPRGFSEKVFKFRTRLNYKMHYHKNIL